MTANVMVVENEPKLRSEIRSALNEAVFQVEDASDYFEALWKLDEFKPDLVVVDEKLPLVSGWEACYELHWTFGIPVILLGEEHRGDIWVEVLQSGADFYLRMPCSYIVLSARIKAILRRYRKDAAGSRN
ncbi:MAG: response regulator [Chloroflexota bacterium]